MAGFYNWHFYNFCFLFLFCPHLSLGFLSHPCIHHLQSFQLLPVVHQIQQLFKCVRSFNPLILPPFHLPILIYFLLLYLGFFFFSYLASIPWSFTFMTPLHIFFSFPVSLLACLVHLEPLRPGYCQLSDNIEPTHVQLNVVRKSPKLTNVISHS